MIIMIYTIYEQRRGVSACEPRDNYGKKNKYDIKKKKQKKREHTYTVYLVVILLVYLRRKKKIIKIITIII